MTEYTPGQRVMVRGVFCGLCNDLYGGEHIGVIGGRAPDDEMSGFGSPPPYYHVRGLTCPACGDDDLYGDTGGALYAHAEIEVA